MQSDPSRAQFECQPNSAVQQPRIRVETRDGTRLYHIDWGKGAPILFVNSWSFTVKTWAKSMHYFAELGYRCVSFDRRGHGRSEDPGRGYDYDTLADDLADVLNLLDLNHVTLVGHSMGCAEIVRYLTRHGSSRVDRIVLTCSTTPFLLKTDDNPFGIDRATFDAVRAKFREDFPQWLVENAPPFVVKSTSQATIDWIVQESLQASFKALMDCNLATISTDFREELKMVDVPTLVIHGDKDVSAPVDITGRPTAALIPFAKFKVYEGAPHGLIFTHVDRLNTDLAEFLAPTAAHQSGPSAAVNLRSLL
jgi:non-heme chloroperoxidase